jgi:hypothetical protein
MMPVQMIDAIKLLDVSTLLNAAMIMTLVQKIPAIKPLDVNMIE